MSDWRLATHLHKLPAKGGRKVLIDSLELGIFHHKGRIFAVDNVCPHAGAPLHKGVIRKNVLHCPKHDWPFALCHGMEDLLHSHLLHTYPTRLQGAEIWVDIADPLLGPQPDEKIAACGAHGNVS